MEIALFVIFTMAIVLGVMLIFAGTSEGRMNKDMIYEDLDFMAEYINALEDKYECLENDEIMNLMIRRYNDLVRRIQEEALCLFPFSRYFPLI